MFDRVPPNSIGLGVMSEPSKVLQLRDPVISNIPRYSKHLKSWYSMTWPFSFRTWYGPPSDGQRWPQEASQWRQSWTIASFPAGTGEAWELAFAVATDGTDLLGTGEISWSHAVPCAMVVNQVLNEIHIEVLTIQRIEREREETTMDSHSPNLRAFHSDPSQGGL